MTSFIERMKAQMTGKNPWTPKGPKKGAERSATTVRTNRFDEQVWKEVRPVEAIDHSIYELSVGDYREPDEDGNVAAFEGAPELVHDLFMTFYKAAADLKGKREVTREAYAVRRLMEEIMGNPRLQELQPMTAGDTLLSTIAVESMMEPVKEILARIPPPPPPPQPKPKKQKQKKQKQEPGEGEGDGEGQSEGEGEGDGQGQSGGGGGRGKPNGQENDGSGGGGGGGQPDEGEGDPDEDREGDGDDLLDGDQEFDPDAEDAEEQAESEWEAMYDELLDEADIDRLANKALQNVEDEVNDLDELRRGIGLEDGEWRTMSPEKRLEIAERLRSPKMKSLAEMIGRMKRFALGVRATRIIDVNHEIYDVETGDDVRRALKSEFAYLGDPQAKYEFYRKLASQELMLFKMRGTENVGKGPIQMCIDKSGSMNGTPFEWAMAVSEALRRFASDEDRDYHAMFFGSNNDRERFDFPKGKGEFEKILAFLSCDANGGTEFDGVLTEALERAEKSFDSGRGKADIVFVTDGQAYLSEEWIKDFNETRERIGVRVYSVYIGGARDMYYQNGPAALLQQISDVVIPVSELRPEAVTSIFERV